MSRPWSLSMQAVGADGAAVGLPESFGPIMTDSAPKDEPAAPAPAEPVPALSTWVPVDFPVATLPAWLQTKPEGLTENSFIASLYEGRPFQEGARLEREYRQQVETARQVEAAKRRRP
jgi:hypothetical protein